MRNDAYAELLEFCKEKYPTATKDFVLKKIHGLRCSFRRELKKVSQRKPGSSADDVSVPNLWYYELLSFIADSETPRQGKSSLGEDTNNDDQLSLLFFANIDIALGVRCKGTKQLAEPRHSPGTTSPDSTSSLSTSAVLMYAQDDGRIILDFSVMEESAIQDAPSDESRPSSALSQEEKQLMELSSKTLQNFNNRPPPQQTADDYDIAGKKYACDLRSLGADQKIIAEKLLSDIIFFGKLNKLNEFTTVQLSQQLVHANNNNVPQPSVNTQANVHYQTFPNTANHFFPQTYPNMTLSYPQKSSVNSLHNVHHEIIYSIDNISQQEKNIPTSSNNAKFIDQNKDTSKQLSSPLTFMQAENFNNHQSVQLKVVVMKIISLNLRPRVNTNSQLK
ncbi:hypothetical protein J6590_101200 [Homalodisca vitripennis]|nr:hypothetical protein J6590_101200 [Homalodisca vitripennis]